MLHRQVLVPQPLALTQILQRKYSNFAAHMHVAAWDLFGNVLMPVNFVVPSVGFGGAYMHGSSNYTEGVSVADAYNIETKFDDGNPASGQIFVVYNRGAGGCLNVGYSHYNVDLATLDWYSDVTFTTPRCQMHFWID